MTEFLSAVKEDSRRATPERFTLIVEAIPPGPPGSSRLKLLLKSLLRRYGLRCVELKQEENPCDKPAVPAERIMRCQSNVLSQP